MQDETESAEAIPNPMIGRRRRQFWFQISIWIFTPYQGLFAQIQVEHQINAVPEILSFPAFVASLSRSKCCRVLWRAEIFIFGSSHPLQT